MSDGPTNNTQETDKDMETEIEAKVEVKVEEVQQCVLKDEVAGSEPEVKDEDDQTDLKADIKTETEVNAEAETQIGSTSNGGKSDPSQVQTSEDDLDMDEELDEFVPGKTIPIIPGFHVEGDSSGDGPTVRQLILAAIGVMKTRKARPDTKRICNWIHRRFGKPYR